MFCPALLYSLSFDLCGIQLINHLSVILGCKLHVKKPHFGADGVTEVCSALLFTERYRSSVWVLTLLWL